MIRLPQGWRQGGGFRFFLEDGTRRRTRPGDPIGMRPLADEAGLRKNDALQVGVMDKPCVECDQLVIGRASERGEKRIEQG